MISDDVNNVWGEQNKQQVMALGRPGWSLRCIQRATGVRRETAAAQQRAAGIAFRPPGKWGRAPAKPANEVISDPEAAKASDPVSPDRPAGKPANEVITDSGAQLDGAATASPPALPDRSATYSACELYRETIRVSSVARTQCRGYPVRSGGHQRPPGQLSQRAAIRAQGSPRPGTGSPGPRRDGNPHLKKELTYMRRPEKTGRAGNGETDTAGRPRLTATVRRLFRRHRRTRTIIHVSARDLL
jgi:hypothetical protein